jgi:hypothetical protein
MSDRKSSFLQSSDDYIARNGRIQLIISAPFNYSELQTTVECRRISNYGTLFMTQLEMFSVAEIVTLANISISTYPRDVASIHDLLYGTNVGSYVDEKRQSIVCSFDRVPFLRDSLGFHDECLQFSADQCSF